MNKFFACLSISILTATACHPITQPIYTPEQLDQLTFFIGIQISDVTQKLADQDLQIFANVVYLTYAQIQADLHKRLLTQTLVQQTNKITKQAHLYMDQKPYASNLAAIDKELAKTVTLLQHLYASWQHCNTLTKTLSDGLLKSHIQRFGNMLEEETAMVAKFFNQEFDAEIKKTQQDLQANGHALNLLAKTFQAILDKELPLKEEGKDQTVDKVALSAKIAYLAQQYAQKVIDSSDQIIDQHMVIQHTSMMICEIYYQALYKQLAMRNKKFSKIMFGPNGILSADQQKEKLPAEVVVFEDLPISFA